MTRVITFLFILVLLAGCWDVDENENAGKKTADAFFELLKKDDYESTHDLFSDIFKTDKHKEELKLLVTSLKALGEFKSYEFVELKKVGSTTEIEGTFTVLEYKGTFEFADVKFTLTMSKVDGEESKIRAIDYKSGGIKNHALKQKLNPTSIQFIEAFAQGDFEACTSLFADVVFEQVDRDTLIATFQRLANDLGSFSSFKPKRAIIDRDDVFGIKYKTELFCKFENGSVSFIFSFFNDLGTYRLYLVKFSRIAEEENKET